MFYLGLILVLIIIIILCIYEIIPIYLFILMLTGTIIPFICNVKNGLLLGGVVDEEKHRKGQETTKTSKKIIIDLDEKNYLNCVDVEYKGDKNVDNLKENMHINNGFILPNIGKDYYLYNYIETVYNGYIAAFKVTKFKKNSVRRFFINLDVIKFVDDESCIKNLKDYNDN